MKTLSVLLLSLLAAGCAMVDTVPANGYRVENGFEPIETVSIDNTCWHLLAMLPIGSGDVDSPNGFGCKLFRNTLSVDSQMKMLQAEADRVGARKAVNVTTVTSDEDFLLFLLLREKVHTSAMLVK